MNAHHGGRTTLFLAPPTMEEAEHLGAPFDASEEAMRRLRNPFQAGSIGTERARRTDGDVAVTTATGC